MWKRDEAVKPTSGQPATPAAPVVHSAGQPAPAAPQPETRRIERDMVNIGKSVVIKGELNGSEDLTIEGHVEGQIELKDHVLTIGPNGKIKAQVFAKAVIVLGEVNGNVTASEKVDIRDGGSVDGDIISPRVAIAEGAHFRGSVDMQRKGAQPARRVSRRPLRARAREGAASMAASTQATARRALTRAERGDLWVCATTGPKIADSLRSVALSDLFSRRRKEHAELGRRCVRCTGASNQGAGAFHRQPERAIAAGAPRPRSRRRLQRQLLWRAAWAARSSSRIFRRISTVTSAKASSTSLPAFLSKRFPQESGSIDGILCWDVFDYLDKKSAKPLAEQLTADAAARRRAAGVFRHGGAAAGPQAEYTRHIVVDRRACSTARIRPRAPTAAVAESRHPAAVRAAAHRRAVPAEDQSARSPVPERLQSAASTAPVPPSSDARLRPHRGAASARAVRSRMGGPRGGAANPRARSRAPSSIAASSRRWRSSACSGSRVPAEYGGAGMDYLCLGLASEELEYVDTSLRVILSVHVGLNCLTLLSWGTEDQKQRYLVPQAQGTKIATYGLTEPSAGSDARGIQSSRSRRAIATS